MTLLNVHKYIAHSNFLRSSLASNFVCMHVSVFLSVVHYSIDIDFDLIQINTHGWMEYVEKPRSYIELISSPSFLNS